MTKIGGFLLLLFSFAMMGFGGQNIRATATAHSVALAWTASSDAAANPTLTYNVYRLVRVCPSGTPTGFTQVGTASATTYSDTAVSVGNTYCYYVTAQLNALQSVPSNTASAVILPAAPTALGATGN